VVCWLDLRDLAVDFQENCYAGDVVDHGIVFPPFLSGCSDYGVSSLFWAVFLEERPNNSTDFFIWEKFPDSITCNNHEFMFGFEMILYDLRFWWYSNTMSTKISEWSAHCETREVLILHPDSWRPEILSHWSLNRVYSTIISFNLFLFIWQWWLMIHADRCHSQLTEVSRIGVFSRFNIGIQNSSWIAKIGTKNRTTIEQNTAKGRSTINQIKLKNKSTRLTSFGYHTWRSVGWITHPISALHSYSSTLESSGRIFQSRLCHCRLGCCFFRENPELVLKNEKYYNENWGALTS